jgi:hypothetical protein
VLATATACAAFGMGAAACGSGPTPASFAKKADPICAKANGEVQQLTKPADLKQVSDVSGKLATSNQTQVDALQKLDQPKKNKAQLTATLTAMKSVTDDANGLKAAADSSNAADIEAKSKAMAEHATAADKSARAYGLAECGGTVREKVQEIQSAVPPMLKQDFIAKADLLCADANRKFSAVPDPTTPKQFVSAIDQTLAINDKLVADLRALFVPEADRQAFEDVLAANGKVASTLNELKPAVQAGDQKKVETLGSNVDTAIADANKKADAFGFKDCGTSTTGA